VSLPPSPTGVPAASRTSLRAVRRPLPPGWQRRAALPAPSPARGLPAAPAPGDGPGAGPAPGAGPGAGRGKEGEGGVFSVQPEGKHPGDVKSQRAELCAGCSSFFPVRQDPAFQIDSAALLPPAQKALRVGGREGLFLRG